MNSALFNEEDVKAEAKQHNDYLNSIVGILAFTLGLSCAGMDNPQKAAWFCLPILFPVLHLSIRHFPPTITALRELEKETKDQHVIEVRKYLEKKYLGIKSLLTKNILYWYGLAFYVAVLFETGFTKWLLL